MTEDDGKQVAVVARDVPVRTQPSVYPEPFASRMAGRNKRQLGDVFELANFGVNLTELAPGANPRCFIATVGRTSSFISSSGTRLS